MGDIYDIYIYSKGMRSENKFHIQKKESCGPIIHNTFFSIMVSHGKSTITFVFHMGVVGQPDTNKCPELYSNPEGLLSIPHCQAVHGNHRR